MNKSELIEHLQAIDLLRRKQKVVLNTARTLAGSVARVKALCDMHGATHDIAKRALIDLCEQAQLLLRDFSTVETLEKTTYERLTNGQRSY